MPSEGEAGGKLAPAKVFTPPLQKTKPNSSQSHGRPRARLLNASDLSSAGTMKGHGTPRVLTFARELEKQQLQRLQEHPSSFLASESGK